MTRISIEEEHYSRPVDDANRFRRVTMWIKVADGFMPETGKKVLAAYKNECGKRRRILAFYAERFSIEHNGDADDLDVDYCEEKDANFIPAGWYECIENWGDYSFVTVDSVVTHWMELPCMPEDSEVRG